MDRLQSDKCQLSHKLNRSNTRGIDKNNVLATLGIFAAKKKKMYLSLIYIEHCVFLS